MLKGSITNHDYYFIGHIGTIAIVISTIISTIPITALALLQPDCLSQQHNLRLLTNIKTLLFSSSPCFDNHLEAYPNDRCTYDNNDNDFLLAKTTESFKLSDLYMMEANLQSKTRKYKEPKSLVMDPNTGSYLFTLDPRFLSNSFDTDCTENSIDYDYKIPSIIHRCDWICEKLAFGKNVFDFLNDIEHQVVNNWGRANDIDINNYSLDYISMGKRRKYRSRENNYKDSNDDRYTSKSLSYRVISLLSSAKCALDPQTATIQLLIIDTPIGIFLGFKRNLKQNLHQKIDNDDIFLKKWKSRPFQYSSAINAMIALIVVDLLNDLVCQQKKEMGSNQRISMIDPTCGSGTFLALALDRDMKVFGFDVHDKCVSGSIRNLEFLFGKEFVNNRSQIEVKDSSTTFKKIDYTNIDHTHGRNLIFDCAISNLPWGQNTKMNFEENKRILDQLRGQLSNNVYCAFITKDDSLRPIMESLGYKVIDSAHVPQTNFILPSSKKGKMSSPMKGGSSDCVVTIVQLVHTNKI